MAIERNEARAPRRLAGVALATLLWLPASAGAQGADELASTIEQSLDGIEFRIDVRPEQAAQDLEEQQRRLELLAREEPDHPALPELRQRIEEVQADLASGLADAATSAIEGDGSAQAAPEPPEEFATGMEEVQELQRQAETELLRGRTEAASGNLERAEAQMSELESRYAAEIPQGHVPLLVARERQSALKDQLDDVTSPD